MPELDNDKQTETVQELKKVSISLLRSIGIFHWLGYGLLVLALFDVIEILVPPQFMNPVWEFQTLGALVERVPVPLIGLALVFYGERNYRANWEIPLLKVLSWLSLLVGILFLLLVPLGIIDTLRINQQNSQRITSQIEQQIAQIQQVKGALEQAQTKEEMEQILSSIDSQGRTPTIRDSAQLTEVKQQISSFITQGEAGMKAQAQATRTQQRLSLLESSVKWNLGALVSGALYIGIWRSTSWLRSRKG
ncbi:MULTISPECIES: HpsJ family protein [unclassified Coleofasciculus]|uniref:HpsJ-like protein, cyanoexosortase A-associated n=1 Tax=unclassified Coleofasciculus TaxID=2692782 RepID=UPI00187E041B|nr:MULTISPECIES: HpsJ family protein [unclassified Coleofasciculus]MBE9127762.1 hypothetical protein [Coleofasciculus sp. LEGE 07081]MBE9149462.1 hypothetical protein [Coleofasciculus sp. LEGE 07092]